MASANNSTFKKILNYFLYGTTSREEYRLNSDGAQRSNNSLVILCLSVCVLFCSVLLAFALILCIFITCNNTYEIITILLAVMPLLSVMFIIPPLGLLITLALGDIACILALQRVYSPEMLKWNSVNLILISAASYIVGASVIIGKQAKLTNGRTIKDLLEKDAMTGIYNRRSFDKTIDEKKTSTDGITLCVLDINSLKKANDEIGHEAGDELIISSASIINDVFAEYGKCFRTGDDEFVVVIDKPTDTNELISRFE